MSHVAIASILPKPEIANAPDFPFVYDLVGQNTGNLVFTQAVWSHLAGPKKHINYFRVPEETNDRFAGVIIPAASWISADPGVDQTMDQIAAWIETLTIPVVVTGLGVQHSRYEPGFWRTIGAGCKRLLRAVADRSATISVRGHYTAEMLADLGFPATRVTGCPSISIDMRPFDPPLKAAVLTPSQCVICPTRYYLVDSFLQQASVDRELFRFGYEHECGFILQSEAEEMQYLLGFSGAALPAEPQLAELYGEQDLDRLRRFVTEKCRVFFRLDQWATAAGEFAFGFGTRLHGTIMLLNSGVPAVLVTHDSRSREVAELARIPALAPESLELSEGMLQEAYAEADLAAYYARRLELRQVYRAFLGENGLTPQPPAD